MATAEEPLEQEKFHAEGAGYQIGQILGREAFKLCIRIEKTRYHQL
jgi:hypothetical protein